MTSGNVGFSPGVTLVAAASALAEGKWDEARALYQAVLAQGETPEALEGLSWAAWWLDDAKTVFGSRERAYRLYQDQGDRYGAARMAMWLASDYINFRGEAAIASGWRQRAYRLLDGLPSSLEHGWLALLSGEFALEVKYDTGAGKRYGETAVDIGRQVRVPDLEAIGLAMRGLALVTEGSIEEGMSCLDEAAVIASTAELEHPLSPAWVSCYLIFACERVRDFERAEQWCRRLEELSKRLHVRLWFASCRTHYAGVLIWRGAWQKAEEELLPAMAQLEAARPPSVAEGLVRLGELRRRQGLFDEAEALFEQAAEHPASRRGAAELALDRDNPKEARALVERLLRHLPGESKTLHVEALELSVRVHAVLGDYARAAVSLADLNAIAGSVGTDPLRAVAAFSTGVLAAMRGEHDLARASFEDAVDLYRGCGAPFETARARAELAKALMSLGETETARREVQTARETFRALGAGHEVQRTESLLELILARSDGGEYDQIGARNGLTQRELEVLRLVAQGLSDKHIAAKLFLSEHTVHRHISNIFAKLGLSTRAAAVAFAARNNLL